MTSEISPSNLPTPSSCIADFCLIPLGTPTASVSKEIADVQRLLKKSGLTYTLHSAGTTVGKATIDTPQLFAREHESALSGRPLELLGVGKLLTPKDFSHKRMSFQVLCTI
jgi:hypothetical protein